MLVVMVDLQFLLVPLIFLSAILAPFMLAVVAEDKVEPVVMEHMMPHMLLLYAHVLFVVDIVVRTVRHVLMVIPTNQLDKMVVQRVVGDGSAQQPALLLELLVVLAEKVQDTEMLPWLVLPQEMLLIMQELVEMVEMAEHMAQMEMMVILDQTATAPSVLLVIQEVLLDIISLTMAMLLGFQLELLQVE